MMTDTLLFDADRLNALGDSGRVHIVERDGRRVVTRKGDTVFEEVVKR